jgi:hypothetical protein
VASGARIHCAATGRETSRAAAPLKTRMGRLLRALTRNRASTSPDAADPRLRGRAYAIPFARVWDGVLETARSRARWRITETDPRRGRITAEARTLLWRFVDDVQIRVSLDAHGLTRVDVESRSRVGRADLGVNTRRIARFLHGLDRHLGRMAARPDPAENPGRP